MSEDWKDRIFSEKSLWGVYKLSRRVLPKPKANKFILWATIGVLVALLAFGIYEGGRVFAESDALDLLRVSAALGTTLAVGILGFLIAGFAIFASVTRAELFITLAKIPYKETGINRLQFVFFNFINVFTVYIGLLSFCLFVSIAFSKSSPLLVYAAQMPSPCPLLPLICLYLINCIQIFWLVAALLKLKSFIWNLYQTVLVSIATEDELNSPTI